MKTLNFKLTLPMPGSTVNWGEIINENFTIIDGELNKIVAELELTRALLGSGVPYYKQLKDNDGNSYNFVLIKPRDIDDPKPYQYFDLFYYTDVHYNSGKLEGVGEPLKYSTYNLSTANNIDTLTNGIGAYVLNEDEDEDGISISYAGKPITVKRGDLLVITEQVGSLLDSKEGKNQFELYPISGLYIEPIVTYTGTPDAKTLYIDYHKKTYPEWVARDKTTTYTVIPAFHFTRADIEDNQAKYEYIDQVHDAVGLCAVVQVYTLSGSTKTPIYIDYTTTITKNTSNHKVTTTVAFADTVPANSYCDICVGYKVPERVTGG